VWLNCLCFGKKGSKDERKDWGEKAPNPSTQQLKRKEKEKQQRFLIYAKGQRSQN
jgi:hypothetical protein